MKYIGNGCGGIARSSILKEMLDEQDISQT